MNTFPVAESICSGCGARLDRATAARHDARPKPGDLTLCLECSLPHQFNAEMQLLPLTLAEFVALPSYARVALLEASLALQAAKS